MPAAPPRTHAREQSLHKRITVTTVDSPATDPPAVAGRLAPSLRQLYLVRFGFAIAWAALLFADRSRLGALGVTLLVVYPLFDVAAAVVDARSSNSAGPIRGLQTNIVISAVAA